MTQATASKPAVKRAAVPPLLKMAIEIGPLVLFFFANSRPKLFEPLVAPLLPRAILEGPSLGLFTATVVLMVGVLVALAISYALTRRLPVMPVVTAVLVLVFGALTLYFQDERFIKMKPTVLYVCFGLALIGGLAFGKSLLPIVLDNAMTLTEQGWRVLTLRWGAFFFILAILNEIIWRTQSTDTWVAFKFPGTLILIFIFTIAQVPLIMRHELKDNDADQAPRPEDKR